MKHLASLLLIAVLLIGSASRVDAMYLQNLGDFEDATFGAWTQTQWSLGPACGWCVTGGPEGCITGVPAGYQANGNYELMADQDVGGSTTIVSCIVRVPQGADSLYMRLFYTNTLPGDLMSPTTIAPGGQGQALRVDLMDPNMPVLGMSGIVSTLYATNPSMPDQVAPFVLAANVSSLRGQLLRLRVAVISNAGQMCVGIDDVQMNGKLFEVVAGNGLPALRDGSADWGNIGDDTDLDLAICGYDGATAVAGVYRNNGGTFSLYSAPPSVSNPRDVKWLDLDRDGDLDVVIGADPIWIGRNTGTGFTWTAQTGLPNSAGSNLAIGDIDCDGDQDLWSTTNGFPMLLRNVGNGSLSGTSISAPGVLDSATVSIRAQYDFPPIDVEGASSTTPTSNLYLLTSPDQGRSYQYSATHPSGLIAGVHEYFGRTRDLQGLEFESGRLPGGAAHTFLTAGNGANLTHPIPGLYDPSVTWGDVDNDGDADLFVTGTVNGAAYSALFLYSSATGFKPSGESFTAVQRGTCRFADYDNDGDLDLLVFGQSGASNVVTLYRNLAPTTNNDPVAGTLDAATLVSPMFNGEGVWLYVPVNSGFSDDHTVTDLTLNFRAGTTPGGVDVITPESGNTAAARLVARCGNAHSQSTCPLTWDLAPGFHGVFHVAAQAVDGAFRASAWSNEVQVSYGPRIVAVQDVPGDQGGAVRLTMKAAFFDTPTAIHPATGYTIYGRVNSAALAAQVAATRSTPGAHPTTDGSLETVTLGERTFVAPAAAQAAGFPAGTWEVLTSLFAQQESQYVVRVNTFADSGAAGPNWSVFVASAHMADPTKWWLSVADSGKSVDNIAPGAPQGVQLSYHPGTHNALSWQPSAAEDFEYFRVYRGLTPAFAIGAGTLVGTTADVVWTDPATGTTGVYYKITALDHAGNESAAATPTITTGVDGGAQPKYAFALAAPSPSPFAQRTSLAFTLPAAQHARLEVFDAAGRRVAMLADGAFAAGPHSLTWDGAADDGTRANAGLLFVRLSAGGREAVRRLILLGGAK
ncbi:MAG: FG-GAP-like repeat-containing protein [Candidatus Eisenbacteria bacterium]